MYYIILILYSTFFLTLKYKHLLVTVNILCKHDLMASNVTSSFESLLDIWFITLSLIIFRNILRHKCLLYLLLLPKLDSWGDD